MRDLNIMELRRLMDLLVYTVAFKSNHQDLSSTFVTDGTKRDILQCIMIVKRFTVLLQRFIFNDTKIMEERLKENPVALKSNFPKIKNKLSDI